MKNHQYQSEKARITGQKRVLTKRPLLGYFMCDEKSDTYCAVFIRGIRVEPLRWNVVDSAFLQQTSAKQVASRVRTCGATERNLSCLGDDPSFALGHHHGVAADQQNRSASIQRKFPGDVGSGMFSGSNDPAPLSPATVAGYDSPVGSTPRQSAWVFVRHSQATAQFD